MGARIKRVICMGTSGFIPRWLLGGASGPAVWTAVLFGAETQVHALSQDGQVWMERWMENPEEQFCNIYLTKCNIYITIGLTYEGSQHVKEIEFENALRLARVEKDLSQQDLGDLVGVTRQTIGLIEAGKYNPTLKLCLLLTQVLDKSLDELFWVKRSEA